MFVYLAAVQQMFLYPTLPLAILLFCHIVTAHPMGDDVDISSKPCKSKSLGVSKDLHKVTEINNVNASVIIDWVNLVQPPECFIHFTEVVLYYDKENETKCCEGFKNETRSPKKDKDISPFNVPLCRKRNSTGNRLIFLQFQVGRHVKNFKEYIKILPRCIEPTPAPGSTKPKPIQGNYWALLLVSGIFAAVVLFCVVLLCCHYFQAKKSNHKDEEGSRTGESSSQAEEPSTSRKMREDISRMREDFERLKGDISRSLKSFK